MDSNAHLLHRQPFRIGKTRCPRRVELLQSFGSHSEENSRQSSDDPLKM